MPLIIYNSAVGLPAPESFQANLDIMRIPFGL
jgi:hypothetical protein